MADPCEVASDVTERWLSSAIKFAATPKPKELFVPNGKCRWCLEPLAPLDPQDPLETLDPVASFCPTMPGETGCRDDWEADQKRKERIGKMT